jgi:hypothetical protein
MAFVSSRDGTTGIGALRARRFEVVTRRASSNRRLHIRQEIIYY